MSLPQDCLVGKVPFLARFNDWASDCTIVTLVPRRIDFFGSVSLSVEISERAERHGIHGSPV